MYRQRSYSGSSRMTPSRRGGNNIRLIMALAFAAFALFSYFRSTSYNEITGEKQHITLNPQQEIALGNQAVPQMIQEYGGEYPDEKLQALIDQIGARIVEQSDARKTAWEFEFYLLDDANTVNAFALPGGKIFLTTALYQRLTTEGQLAGVLAHEIGHVVARHSAEQLAKQELTQGLIGSVAMGGSYSTAQMAQLVGNMVSLKYGRDDELQADNLGVLLMSEAGYDPRALIQVMQVLQQASGGGGQPEFLSTHPYPTNRMEKIQAAIQAIFPNGLPTGLTP